MFMAATKALMMPSATIGLVAYTSAALTSNTASLVLNKPTGTADGDLMVAFMWGRLSATTWTGDTGWTEALDQGAAPAMRVAWKVAASEGSSYTFTASSSAERPAGAILTYRKASIDAVGASVVTTADASAIVASGVTAAGGILLAFYASAIAPDTFTTPTGMASVTGLITDTFDNAGNIFAQKITAGSTGTRSSTPSASAAHGGILISLK